MNIRVRTDRLEIEFLDKKGKPVEISEEDIHVGLRTNSSISIEADVSSIGERLQAAIHDKIHAKMRDEIGAGEARMVGSKAALKSLYALKEELEKAYAATDAV